MADAGKARLCSLLFVVVDDFLNDEVQEFLGEFRVQIGPFRKIFEPRDLFGFARGIGRRQVVLRLQNAHGLCVFEPLAQRVDQNGVQPVDAFSMLFEQFSGAGHGILGLVSQWPSLSV